MNTEDTTWFTEAELPYSQQDIKISTRVTKVLHDEQSPFGHVQVLETPYYGRLLALDGIIQVAEKDEFIYHEMMIALPAVQFGKPKKVLIIGGGDGGAVKQALRIKDVEKVVLVEIDRLVIDVCEKFMPSIPGGSLQDERVEVVIQDGLEYVKNCQETFDIVSLDLTDPIPDSPSAALYAEPFYNDIKRLLGEHGILSTHCGSLLFQLEEAKLLQQRLQKVFPFVSLHSAVIPTYQLTSFGFLIASLEQTTQEKLKLGFDNLTGQSRYLTPEMYQASSVIPPYIAEQIGL